MSSRKLKVNIAGLNVLLEVGTQEGYRMLEEWLRDFRKEADTDFTLYFSHEEERFRLGFEGNLQEDQDEIIQMSVKMGHIDNRNRCAMGPDAARVNKELARFLFSNSLRIVVQYVLPKFGGVLLHASAVVGNGKSYVFIGPNDGGKTTIAQNTGKVILSDDCIGLNRIDGEWNACATPWGNIHNSGLYPVACIFFISKSDRLESARVDRLSAVKRLFSNICTSFPSSQKEASKVLGYILSILEQVCGEIPAYTLRFRKDDNVFDEIKRCV
jgi:hypothetical protein